MAYLPDLPYSRGIGVRSGMRAPGRRMGVIDIMLGCVGDRFLYGDNVSNLYKAINTEFMIMCFDFEHSIVNLYHVWEGVDKVNVGIIHVITIN